jgi:hypothetical protein
MHASQAQMRVQGQRFLVIIILFGAKIACAGPREEQQPVINEAATARAGGRLVQGQQ